MPSRDITEFVLAARSGDPRVLTGLAERFPTSRLHLPLESLEGVRNRPETALEMKETLPIHRIRLEHGGWAIPLFTRLALCRECAAKLSWLTGGKAIKTLALAGSVALEFLESLLVDPKIERVIVNPLTEAELHLARTDVEAIAQRRVRPSLWFYTRQGRLKQPVEIEGGSLFGSLLSRADRALQKLTDATFDSGDESPLVEVLRTEDIPGSPPGPLSPLSAEICRLLLRENVAAMKLTISKSQDGLSVRADPHPESRLLQSVEEVAQKHLSEHDGDLEVCFRVAGSSIVVTSGPGARAASEGEAPLTRPKGRRKDFDYIPLEPEAPAED